MNLACMAHHARRTLGEEIVEMLHASTLDAASELPTCRTAPLAGCKARLQTAQEAARAAASSADDAQTKGSTPPGALNEDLSCMGVGQCHGSHSPAANNRLLHAPGMHEKCNLSLQPWQQCMCVETMSMSSQRRQQFIWLGDGCRRTGL